ncbi:MAG: hypothetical protein HZB31_04330 [Nitrospirae bacterium]|nr:hypothetical protein [Nitrospirota bacterium]
MAKAVIAVFAVVLLCLLVLRSVMLWYWKINEIVGRLDEIVMELRRINERNITR